MQRHNGLPIFLTRENNSRLSRRCGHPPQCQTRIQISSVSLHEFRTTTPSWPLGDTLLAANEFFVIFDEVVYQLDLLIKAVDFYSKSSLCSMHNTDCLSTTEERLGACGLQKPWDQPWMLLGDAFLWDGQHRTMMCPKRYCRVIWKVAVQRGNLASLTPSLP